MVLEAWEDAYPPPEEKLSSLTLVRYMVILSQSLPQTLDLGINAFGGPQSGSLFWKAMIVQPRHLDLAHTYIERICISLSE